MESNLPDFPDLSDVFDTRENPLHDLIKNQPIRCGNFPTVDLDECFRNIIEEQPSGSVFDYKFEFDPKTGNARSMSVATVGSGSAYQPHESLSSEERYLSKLDFLNLEENLDEFVPKVKCRALPDDLRSFVQLEFSDLIDKQKQPSSSQNSEKAQAVINKNVTGVSRVVSNKGKQKQEFEFAKLLKPGEEFEPKEKVVNYPFELDFFQKAAVVSLENREHVFVAAHTSAGKTVVAEWAIMLAVNNHRKAIYTSPIKALSNQKFRDFKQKFVGNSEYANFSCGILTGDVQIDPDSSCLIMTTEILRSMLYLNSSVIADVDFVVFDEVHYISDEERGVVWEETLIMLPPSVTIVMLSATVGNAMQFANWVGGIKKRMVNVVFTTHRPVPLTHYLYSGFSERGKKEPEKIAFLTAEKTVNEVMVRKMETIVRDNRDNGVSKFERLFKLLLKLRRDSLLPVIVFVFSKKQIEELSAKIKGEYVDKHESWNIRCFIRRKLETVKADYVKYSRQVEQMEALLVRGIGVHHSGILPIMKEIVELLFANGFVKVLFATETFAMGVNMPAKSVIFTAVFKFGNIDNSTKLGRRLLKPEEYIQMAGRAGRRGLDSTGTVIIFCDRQVPHSQEMRALTATKLPSLRSHFQVTYSMILKIFRSESQLNIEDMMGRSFSEIRRIFHHEKSVSKAATLEKDLESDRAADIDSCLRCSALDLQKYVLTSADYFKTASEIYSTFKQRVCADYLKVGRLVVLNWQSFENILGVVVQVSRDSFRVLASIGEAKGQPELFTAPATQSAALTFPVYGEPPVLDTSAMTPCLISCNFDHILYISTVIAQLKPSSAVEIVQNFEQRAKYQKIPFPFSKLVYETLENLSVLRIQNWDVHQHRLPCVDILGLFPSKAKSIRVHDLKTEFEQNEKYLKYFHTECEDFLIHAKAFRVRLTKEDELKKLHDNLSNESLQHYRDYKEREAILKRCGYLNPNDKLTLKGKIACQISIQEIPITEALFANLFHELSTPEIAGFLSIFVFQGPASEEPDVQNFVENVSIKEVILKYFDVRETLMKEANIADFGIVGYGDVCVNLADTVFLFSNKATYSEIIGSVQNLEELGAKPVLEGDIVRCLQRVEYLVRELLAAAFLIGDSTLAEKFTQVHATFKTELVFVNSLYLQS